MRIYDFRAGRYGGGWARDTDGARLVPPRLPKRRPLSDVGPCNGLLDDWLAGRIGEAFDKDEALARKAAGSSISCVEAT